MSDRRMIMYGAPPVPRPRRVGDEPQRGFPLPPYIPNPDPPDSVGVKKIDEAAQEAIRRSVEELQGVRDREFVKRFELRRELRNAEESIKAAITAEHEETRKRIDALALMTRTYADILESLEKTLTKVLSEKKRAMKKKPAKRRAKSK